LRCIKCGGVLPSCLDCKHYEGKINQLKAQRDELLEAVAKIVHQIETEKDAVE